MVIPNLKYPVLAIFRVDFGIWHPCSLFAISNDHGGKLLYYSQLEIQFFNQWNLEWVNDYPLAYSRQWRGRSIATDSGIIFHCAYNWYMPKLAWKCQIDIDFIHDYNTRSMVILDEPTYVALPLLIPVSLPPLMINTMLDAIREEGGGGRGGWRGYEFSSWLDARNFASSACINVHRRAGNF